MAKEKMYTTRKDYREAEKAAALSFYFIALLQKKKKKTNLVHC